MLGKSGEGLGLEWKNGASLEGLTNNCQFEYCFDDIEICSLSFKYASVNFENECVVENENTVKSSTIAIY